MLYGDLRMGSGGIAVKEQDGSFTVSDELGLQPAPNIGTFLRTMQASSEEQDDWKSSDSPDLPKHLISNEQHSSKLARQELGAKLDVEELLSESRHLTELGGYELLSKAGHGGMGVVYRAKEKQTGEIVALKVIASHRLAEEDQKRRFVLEAETAALLQHPHIVSVSSAGQDNGFHFMVMDYIESIALSHLLDDQPLEVGTAARLTLYLAETLHYVHQQGVLHRDLKPSNVLIDASGKPWLTDFGVAKRIMGEDWVTATGMLIGTPSYMPPEQITGKHELMGPASDVYSLGAVLYEVLTGRPPFRSGTPFDTLQMALYNQPAPLRRYNSKIPKALEIICLKCLAKAPQKRYANTLELAKDLQAFLEKRPISAKRQTATWSDTHSDWNEKTGLRDPEIFAQWGLVWKWNALLIFVLFLGFSIAQWGELSPELTELVLAGAGFVMMTVIVWTQRFHYAKPFTILEWQIARLWLLFACGAVGVLLIGYQMDWSWSQTYPMLLLFGAMGFGCMTLFVDRSFALMTLFCMMFSAFAMTLPSLPPILFGIVFALGLYFPSRKYV